MRAKFINEKFKEESDPIKDMGIGWREQLKKKFEGNDDMSDIFKNLANDFTASSTAEKEKEKYKIWIKLILENENLHPAVLHKGLVYLLETKEPDLELIDLILKKEVRVTYNKCQSIKVAARYGNIDMIKRLVSLGADPKIDFNAPIRAAAENNQYDAVQVLLDIIRKGNES